MEEQHPGGKGGYDCYILSPDHLTVFAQTKPIYGWVPLVQITQDDHLGPYLAGPEPHGVTGTCPALHS